MQAGAAAFGFRGIRVRATAAQSVAAGCDSSFIGANAMAGKGRFADLE